MQRRCGPGPDTRGRPAGNDPRPVGTVRGDTSADGRWVFVSDGRGVTVLRAGPATAPPTVVRSVPLPAGQSGLGEALTPGGRYLLVAAMSETVVLDVARLESGSAQPVVGSLSAAGGAIEVVTSPDGRFAFTSLEGTGAVEVSGLARVHPAGDPQRGVQRGQRRGLQQPVEAQARDEAHMVGAADMVDARPGDLVQERPGGGRIPVQQIGRRKQADAGKVAFMTGAAGGPG